MNLTLKGLENETTEKATEKTIQSLGEFINYIQECNTKNYSSISDESNSEQIVYRGQANVSWDCKPKVFRKKEWFENEKTIINETLRRCPNEFEGLDSFEKLVKMQHYGAPTRLLDFTGNPLIALYFACDDDSQKDKDGVVLLCKIPMFYENGMPLSLILKNLFPDYSNNFIQINAPSIEPVLKSSNAVGIRAKLRNERIKNQDGYFAFFTYSGVYPEKLFNPLEANNCIKEKIIIPSDCKADILSELNSCGINRAFVYPELENQIKEICKKF